MPDDVRLTLLEQSLTPAGLAELKRRRERAAKGGPPVTYAGMWNWVSLTYGQDTRISTLEELRALEPVNTGRLTSDAWLTYSNEFRLRLARLEEEVGEQEVIDWPLARVPETIRTAIMREESKRNRQHPTLRLTGVQGIPQQSVLGMISSAIGRPEVTPSVRVEVQGQGYLLHLPSEEVADLLLTRSGQPVRSGHTPIFTKVKKRLSLEERFSWVYNELKCQEASSSCARAYGTWQNSNKRSPNNHQNDNWHHEGGDRGYRQSPGRRENNWEVRAVETEVVQTPPPGQK